MQVQKIQGSGTKNKSKRENVVTKKMTEIRKCGSLQMVPVHRNTHQILAKSSLGKPLLLSALKAAAPSSVLLPPAIDANSFLAWLICSAVSFHTNSWVGLERVNQVTHRHLVAKRGFFGNSQSAL